MAPFVPEGNVVLMDSPAITRLLVVSVPISPVLPVRGIVSPASAGLFRTLSGVSPCATCQTISPLSRLIAVMRPYGGFSSGNPLTSNTGSPDSGFGEGTGGAPIGLPARGVLFATPCTYSMSEILGLGDGTNPSADKSVREYTYKMCVSGS